MLFWRQRWLEMVKENGHLISCTSCLLCVAQSCNITHEIFVFKVHGLVINSDTTNVRSSAWSTHWAPSLAIWSLINLSVWNTHFDAVCILACYIFWSGDVGFLGSSCQGYGQHSEVWASTLWSIYDHHPTRNQMWATFCAANSLLTDDRQHRIHSIPLPNFQMVELNLPLSSGTAVVTTTQNLAAEGRHS